MMRTSSSTNFLGPRLVSILSVTRLGRPSPSRGARKGWDGLAGTPFWALTKSALAWVAAECAEFCSRIDPARDGLWLLVDAGRILGSIAIDGAAAGGAHLRWFIVADEARGGDHGRPMLEAAMAFCRRAGHRRVHLTTFAGLEAARALYERQGFRRVSEAQGGTWGTTVREQRFEWSA